MTPSPPMGQGAMSVQDGFLGWRLVQQKSPSLTSCGEGLAHYASHPSRHPLSAKVSWLAVEAGNLASAVWPLQLRDSAGLGSLMRLVPVFPQRRASARAVPLASELRGTPTMAYLAVSPL